MEPFLTIIPLLTRLESNRALHPLELPQLSAKWCVVPGLIDPNEV